MALSKEIVLNNGVITNYHRVTSLNIITNVQNMIEVSSYTGEAKRIEEQEAIESGCECDVFIHTQIISAPYKQGMTIQTAYDYLKALPQFEGAKNV